jgi:hypothetical protein
MPFNLKFKENAYDRPRTRWLGDVLDTRKREKSWKEMGEEIQHSSVQNGNDAEKRKRMWRETGDW